MRDDIVFAALRALLTLARAEPALAVPALRQRVLARGFKATHLDEAFELWALYEHRKAPVQKDW